MTKALRILFLYNGIFVFAGSLLGPLYAVFVETIDADVLTISITWTAFLVSTTAFLFLVARLGDRVPERKYMLLAGMAVRVVAWFMFIFVDSLTMLLAIQILIGLGEALGSPAFDAMLAEHLARDGHVRAYADWKIVAMITTAAGTILGGIIISAYGFTPIFALMSFIAVVAFVGIFVQPRSVF